MLAVHFCPIVAFVWWSTLGGWIGWATSIGFYNSQWASSFAIASMTIPLRLIFLKKLLAVASDRPDAAIVYADCQFFGESTHVEATASIEGEKRERLRQFIQYIAPTACRGIARKEAIVQAGPLRLDEFRSNHQIFVWLLKMLRWGSFIRFPEPIYYRRIHATNYHKENQLWSDEKKLGDWTTIFTGFLEAVIPECNSVEERVFFQHYILDRVCVLRPGVAYNLVPSSIEQSGLFMSKCFERLALEGRMHEWLVPQPLQAEFDLLGRKNRRLKSRSKKAAREYELLKSQNYALSNSRSTRLARLIRRLLGAGRWPGKRTRT